MSTKHEMLEHYRKILEKEYRQQRLDFTSRHNEEYIIWKAMDRYLKLLIEGE